MYVWRFNFSFFKRLIMEGPGIGPKTHKLHRRKAIHVLPSSPYQSVGQLVKGQQINRLPKQIINLIEPIRADERSVAEGFASSRALNPCSLRVYLLKVILNQPWASTGLPGQYHSTTISPIPELHADLFSRHASPLEVYVFVAIANRGEDVMSDEICRRFNGKQQ